MQRLQAPDPLEAWKNHPEEARALSDLIAEFSGFISAASFRLGRAFPARRTGLGGASVASVERDGTDAFPILKELLTTATLYWKHSGAGVRE
jgi:hypothetical protein